MKIIKIILLVVCIFIFLFCLYNFIIVFEEKKESQNIKEQLIEISQVSPLEQTNEEETLNLINFTELKKVNSDIVGWITIDGTQVNYPIVQGKDNSYYLNHSSNKSYNSLGSIFMDYNSNKDFKDFNTFIYGHNTKNGSMFGEIKKYMDVNFYKKHPFFFLYTPSQNYKVEIFSVYVDEATSNSYNQSFITEDDFRNYLHIILNKSVYKTNVNLDYKKDKIITLYSCSHQRNSKYDRYFIHGKLVVN